MRHLRSSSAQGALAWATDTGLLRDMLGTAGLANWHSDAACREHPEIRWVDAERVHSQVSTAKAICAACLVRTECLAAAMADPSLVGIWGSTTTSEREVLRRQPALCQPARDGQPQQAMPANGSHAPVLPQDVTIRRPLNASQKKALRSMTNNDVSIGITNSRSNNDEATERAARIRTTRAVTRYLDSLAGKMPPAKRTTRSAEAAIANLDERLSDPDLSSTKRLKLLQDRRNLQTHGLPSRNEPSPDDFVHGFIIYGLDYARSHAIDYDTFLEFGVAAEILDKAGIRPTPT